MEQYNFVSNLKDDFSLQIQFVMWFDFYCFLMIGKMNSEMGEPLKASVGPKGEMSENNKGFPG